ncbi:hypothetical protein Hanom_Chr10g00890971 [Helianthus anomalus]
MRDGAVFRHDPPTSTEPRRQWWRLWLCSASEVSGLVWFKPRVDFSFTFRGLGLQSDSVGFSGQTVNCWVKPGQRWSTEVSEQSDYGFGPSG